MSDARQPVALAARPGAPGCRFCGVPLTPHQVVRGLCASPACETQQVQEASRRVFQRNWQDYVERQRLGIEAAAAQVASAVRQLGEPAERVAIGVVPYQHRPVVALPAARSAEFVAHLDAIIAKAFEAGDPPEPDLNRREVDEADEGPLAGATCATCQGRCCFLGGTKAFLTVETIQLFRSRNPDATAEAIRAYYLSRLPDRSTEHSCVYHGERGCTLSREVRADICNRYHCNPQSDLIRRFRKMGAKSAVIVANDDEAGPAVGVYDAQGWRPHAHGDVDDVPAELVGRALSEGIAQAPPDMPSHAAPARPLVPVCAWCGAPTDRHRAVTRQSCGKPDCERRRTAEITAEFERGKAARHTGLVRRMRARHGAALDRAADAAGAAPQAVALGVVTAAVAPLEPLGTDRRAAFAAHLDAIIAEGFATPPEAEGEGAMPGEGEARGAPEPALAASACTVCRGGCCRGGGDRAYLGAAEIVRLRRRDPALTPDRVRAYFLSMLPERSVRGSCIYHSPTGCTQPREVRSDICNGFRCRGLSALLDEAESPEIRAAVIVAVDDDDAPVRAGVFTDEAGLLPEDPGPAGSD